MNNPNLKQSIFSLHLAWAACLALACPALTEAAWNTVDEFLGAQDPADGAYGYDIGTDASGNLFTVGGDMNTDGTYHQAVIRKSTDTGWLEDFSGFIPDAAIATTLWAFAADRTAGLSASGRLYAAGETAIGAGGSWLVCQSDDGVISWHSSDVFQYQPGFGAKCSSLAVDHSGNVYAVGYAYAKNQMFWAVRKS